MPPKGKKLGEYRSSTWVTWCVKKAKCGSNWCEGYIECGQPMVVTRMKREDMGWYITIRKHMHCWVNDALKYLEGHPYKTHTPGTGRKRLELSDETRKERIKILRDKAALVQRQKSWGRRANKGEVTVAVATKHISELGDRINAMAKRLEEIGGVPAGWFR